jgi:DnaK suppressor protein
MTVQLTPHQINEFKTKLNDRFMALRREISAELLRSDEEHYVDLAGQVRDTGDVALADLLVDIKLASIDRHIQEIRDIDAALMGIATGSYGQCSNCQQPIPIERLNANPAAQRCIICQEAHDRIFAHSGQPTL